MGEKDLLPYVVPDRMVEISEGLLEDIRHELVSIDRWYAFEPEEGKDINLEEGITIINNKEFLVRLDFDDLIKKIDKVL